MRHLQYMSLIQGTIDPSENVVERDQRSPKH